MKLLPNFRSDRLQYEFLPAAEEIIETPPPPFGRIVIWIITALLIIAFAWSYFGQIDIIAGATGKIAPEGSIKTIQPANAGVVTDIKVSEGQKVKKGQLLIQLDDSIAKSEVKTAQQSLTVAKLQNDILARTITGEDVAATVNAADISDELKQHLIDLAESKVSASEVQRQLLSSGVASAQQQLEAQKQAKQTIQDNLQKSRTREQELKYELESANALTTSGIQSNLSSAQQQITSLEASLAGQDQQISQAQIGISEANEKLNSYNAENKSSVYSDIIDQDKRIADIENALAKAKQNVEQLSIKAPVDGIVLSLATKTVGGVVSGAQPIVEIVPDGTPLIVEANVQNKDIGFIHVGQHAVVKVDTYSFHRYGYLEGKVKSISPDAISDEKQGLIYKMKVEVDTTKTSKDNTLKVEPGMSVTAEITTGKRRIIEFFLDPLMTYTDTSLEVR
jgi:HlyD family type I secretion membrane fusion protein